MTEPTGPNDAQLEVEARALLGAVREPPPMPDAFRAQARSRLLAALPMVAVPVVAPRGLVARALASRVPGWSLIASFVVGGAVGAVGVARLQPRQSREQHAVIPSTPTSSVMSSPAVVASPALSSSEAASPVTSAAARTTSSAGVQPTRAAAPSSTVSADASLEAERALLDIARTAVGRSDGASALRAAEAHARKFPRGALSEEREAMIVQALRLLHRDEEARARLDRFRGRYPTSLLRPALEATDGGGP